MTQETATLGGGCFWCLEATFEMLEGVLKVVSGYAGGTVEDPSYKAVCTGKTGHAEVVQVTFDAAKLPFPELLEVFFSIHDPTTVNRQGADVGTQYRSIILTHDENQRKAAEDAIRAKDASGSFPSRVVTQVQPLKVFYPAEDYHQGYFRKNPGEGYCQMVISPKVAKMRRAWAGKLKPRA